MNKKKILCWIRLVLIRILSLIIKELDKIADKEIKEREELKEHVIDCMNEKFGIRKEEEKK